MSIAPNPRVDEATGAEDLKTFKRNGRRWLKSYLEGYKGAKIDLLVIQASSPNPTKTPASIYPYAYQYKKVSAIVQRYYSKRGISVTISGPEGLGSVGGGHVDVLTLSLIIHWVLSHKLVLSFIPKLYAFSKFVYSSYRSHRRSRAARLTRSIKPGISLNLSMYIDTGEPIDDLIVYMQQLLISLPSLMAILPSYLDFKVYCSVFDARSKKSIRAYGLDFMTPENLVRLVEKLNRAHLEWTRLDLLQKKGHVRLRYHKDISA